MPTHFLIRSLTAILLLLTRLTAGAQDPVPGTWQMEYKPADNRSPMTVTMMIGTGERNILYPVQLTLASQEFQATYQFLLVKRDSRQFAIGALKYAQSENPFSLGNRTLALNGYFDLSRDYRENAMYLTATRIFSRQPGIKLTDLSAIEPVYRDLATGLFSFFAEADIRFKKTDNNAWDSPDAYRILDPKTSPAYLGIKDTVILNRKDATILYPRNKKTDNDSISMALNGKIFADQVALNRKKEPDEILLDTGINILVAFAEGFGKTPPSQARVEVDFAYKKWAIDFSQKEDLGAGFIVTRLLYDNEEASNTKFAAYYDALPVEKINSRNSKLLGSLVSTSNEITIALWDDAVEDGDTISLNVNGEWVAKNFPVLKRPQFIKVKIKPGPNTMTFVANNLGSIPPNTAVLEIIDGKKRKSFNLDTDLEMNNLVRIYYDFKPDD